MYLWGSAALRYFAALTAAGFCVRPEKVETLKRISSEARGVNPCGLEVFRTLSAQSTLGDARDLFLAGCQEKYPADQCIFAVDDLWLGRDLASTDGLGMDSDLCKTLRVAVEASERSGFAQYSETAASVEGAVSTKVRSSRSSVGGEVDVGQKEANECSNPTSLALKNLPETGIQGGRCMDGSSAGYYYSPPSDGESPLWVIFLDGGGLCYDPDACQGWIDTKKGSNETWAGTIEVGKKCGPSKMRFLADDPTFNPDFHDAHHVYVPYCTGDTHAGQVSDPTDDQWGYYFDGHLNFKAIVKDLIDTLPPANRVLLHGTSAGGKGTFHNCDWLRRVMNRGGRSAHVSCAPHSGWFMPGDAEDNPDSQAGPTPWEFWSRDPKELNPDADAENKEIRRIHKSYLPTECTSIQPSAEKWRCGSVHVMYPHMVADVFVVQDIFDTNQIYNQLGLPDDQDTTTEGKAFIAYVGRAMVKSTEQVVNHPLGKSGDGLFLTSCFNHGSGRGPRLNGNPAHHKDAAIADWFWNRGSIPNISVDTCTMDPPGLPCNPGCKGVPED